MRDFHLYEYNSWTRERDFTSKSSIVAPTKGIGK